MRKRIGLCALLLAAALGTCALGPGERPGGPLGAISSPSGAEAAVGRGDGGAGSGGAAPQVSQRATNEAIGFFVPIFFLALACALAAFLMQRNAGAAVAVLVGGFVVGAFLMVPDQVESLFRAIYQRIF